MSQPAPILEKWTIQYDTHGMPAVLTGKVFCDMKPFKRGDKVVIENLFQLDLTQNTAIDQHGIKWDLRGSGQQLVLVDHTEPFKFIHVADVEEEDPDDPGFD